MYTRQPGRLIEEAQRWGRVLKDADPDEQAAFAAWIKRSPQNLQAFLQHLALETELQGLDAGGEFDIDALLAKASTNVIQLSSSMPMTPATSSNEPTPARRWRLFGAIAAGGIFACLTLAGVLNHPKWASYSTDTGEQRRIVLSDGSAIELNTQSHIRVLLRSSSREVELLSGEALFNVHHDATRPFRVRVADKVIEDLGTQFSIYLRPDASTTVSVLDGRVQILSPQVKSSTPVATSSMGTPMKPTSEPISGPTQLIAGEQVRIAAGGEVIKRAPINVGQAAAWREHRLWFESATLPEVAAEFNRYNKQQLRVGEGATLLKKRYTGVFDAYDPESFVQALRDDPAFSVQADGDGALIQALVTSTTWQ